MKNNRKVMDCRLYPSDNKCSLCITGTEEEVLKTATAHAVKEHGHKDIPELKEQLRQLLKDENEA